MGRLELWPVSHRATRSWLGWRVDMRLLATLGDRSFPLDSPTCRLRVHAPCTGGSGPVWSRRPSVLRSSATIDRSVGRARQG